MRRFGTSRTIFWRFFFYLISPPSSLLFKMKQYLATGKIENKIQLVKKSKNGWSGILPIIKKNKKNIYIDTYIKKKLHAHNVIYTGTASLSVKKKIKK